MGWSFHLNEEGITFWKDGLIVYDCPLERIKNEPKSALIAMKLITELYSDKDSDEEELRVEFEK